MTKILLVEDDKSLREIYGVRLLAEGYDIVSAGDGEEALAMAIKERPQLIVSDVMMPKISGFDMLDILRSTTETKSIKVIMMTALSSEDQRARGQALGADRYLVKSQVGIEDVVRTVHEVLVDAPVAGQPTPNFGPPAASNPVPPRPAPTVPPRPIAEPVVITPAAPVAPPVFSNTVPARPVFNPPVPPSQASGLPQPTAPFSGTRPANLGERVIHPITTVGPSVDLASRMSQELEAGNTPARPEPIAPAASIPVAPPPPPPLPQQPPISEPPVAPPPATLATPSIPIPPPVTASEPSSAPTDDTSSLQFEETPLSPANQSPPNKAL